LGFSAVAFVKGQPRKPDAVGQGSLNQFLGDHPLGPVDHVIGDIAEPFAAGMLSA